MKEKMMTEFKILCPFCSAPYTAEMEDDLYASTSGCSTCGSGAEINGTFTIVCSNCQKEVYKKEY